MSDIEKRIVTEPAKDASVRTETPMTHPTFQPGPELTPKPSQNTSSEESTQSEESCQKD